MRLRVSIKRYTLPEVHILFATRSLNPDPATSSHQATISQLLQDVDDVVPLQNDDWGLEDYAVEVKGYECLHYAPYESVLRDNDELVIRPLKTEDLRQRSLGGRHQISCDGRHLIDGIAFGRQWLKKHSRPIVSIPPRKKRRLEIRGADAQQEEVDDGPLALPSSKTTGAFNAEDSDEEDDSDFVDENAEGNTENENEQSTEPQFTVDAEAPLQITAGQDFEDADEESMESSEEDDSEKLDDDQIPDKLAEISAELQSLREEYAPPSTHVSGEQREAATRSTLASEETKIITSARKRTRDIEEELEAGAETDFNGFSSPPKGSELDNDRAVADSDSDTTSSSESASDSDSDSEDEVQAKSQSRPVRRSLSLDGSADSDDSSTNSDDSSSDESDSDAESDASSDLSSSSSETSDIASSEIENKTAKGTPEKDAKTSTQTVSTLSPQVDTAPRRATVPPGQGSTRTKYDNQRQKMRKRLSSLKESGLLHASANFKDLAAFDEVESNIVIAANAKMNQLMTSNTDVDYLFAAKKKELLQQVNEPNPNMTWEATDNLSQHSTPRRNETSHTHTSSEARGAVQTPLHERPAKELLGSLLAPSPDIKSGPSTQRAKLDLNASRNLIFGGLGVRKPKTAAQEQALREKLEKPVKGALPKQLFREPAVKPDRPLFSYEEPETEWQSKLILSAVECELDGVTLKEPPFPFVQGWDEDANRRYSKNKKKGRSQRQYYNYDEDAAQRCHEGEKEAAYAQDTSIVDDRKDGINHRHFDDDETAPEQHEKTFDGYTAPTGDETMTDGDVEQQLTNVCVRTTANTVDLPRPGDIASLPPLQLENALPGAVIAYKELHISANFQPEISGYRIARVESILEDGNLALTLSTKDRRPSNAVKYDRETGKRILRKFEIPGEDEEAGEDDGSRTLSFADLIEPKILETPAASDASGSMKLTLGASATRGLSNSAEVPVIPPSAVSDNTAVTSTQPDAQTVSVSEPQVAIDVPTPRRAEISDLIKEAGFNSTLDAELLQPIAGVNDSRVASQVYSNRKASAEPGSEAPAPDTSGFDSPRFNGWSSSVPVEQDENLEEPEEFDVLSSRRAEETGSMEDHPPRPKTDVKYPHISQLDLDSSMPEESSVKLRGGDAGPPVLDLSDTQQSEPQFSEPDVVEETNPDSLNSVVPPSVDEYQEAQHHHPLQDQNVMESSFLGGLNGNVSSGDDEEMPSLEQITSSARARSPRVSPPQIVRRAKAGERQKQKQLEKEKAANSFAESDDHFSMKQSQSQAPRLSQIPAGSQVVDLTFSSDPVSPGNSDGEFGTGRVKRTTRASSQTKALESNGGLGNRRFLKSKKAKP